MEEKQINLSSNGAENIAPAQNGDILNPELQRVVSDLILEFKKSGSITTTQLFDNQTFQPLSSNQDYLLE